MSSSTEIFVIGGGPAGLATAIAARLRGFDATVADGAFPPIDKPCGEGLMPDSLPALEKLGIRFSAEECYPFSGVRYLASGMSADADFPTRRGLGVRRTILHKKMIERATELGVNLLWQTPVTGIFEQGVSLPSRNVRAKWIVGADGANSSVRRWAGLEACAKTSVRYGFRRHYRIEPRTDRMELHWAKSAQAYVAHVTPSEACVGLMSRDPSMRADQALSFFPELAARLRGAEITSMERGAASCTRKLKHVFRKNVALVGDASGTVDVITGEGLGISFRQALALADCLQLEDLSRYQKEHRRLALRPSIMARLMLLFDGRPWLQRRTLKAFGNRPRVFRTLLALHVGEISPRKLAWDGMSLGWGLLTA